MAKNTSKKSLMEPWTPIAASRLATNVCLWREGNDEWEIFPVFIVHHGELRQTRCLLDDESPNDVFVDDCPDLLRPYSLSLDDPDLVDDLQLCTTNAPREFFGEVQLMVKADGSDKVVYLVAKRAPRPSVSSKPKPASQQRRLTLVPA